MPERKQLVFVGSSLADLKSFPEGARRTAGFELAALQRGALPGDWKAMPSVGRGVMELRIHRPGEWRVIYITRMREAIYVLHAFQKKSRRTSRVDLELAKRRLQDIEDRS